MRVTIAIALLLATGGCWTPHVYTDLSGDPQYSPGGIVGRCFRLREGGYLLRPKGQPRGKGYQILAAPDERTYPAMSEVESGKWDRNRYGSIGTIVAILPAGTLVCVRKIVRDETLKDKPLQPLAVIVDGKQFMNEFLVSPTLVAGPDPLMHWTAVETFLLPRDLPSTAPRSTTGP